MTNNNTINRAALNAIIARVGPNVTVGKARSEMGVTGQRYLAKGDTEMGRRYICMVVWLRQNFDKDDILGEL